MVAPKIFVQRENTNKENVITKFARNKIEISH